MKTDRFDEEFRRKLQDLPGEATPGEVERTFAYVRMHKPAVPGLGWGKLLLLGGGSLLLIGSLVYNGIQHRHTTWLQTSLDSLVHHPISPAKPTNVIQHDTIYITRTDEVETGVLPALPTSAPFETARKSAPFTDQSSVSPSSGHQIKGSVATGRQNTSQQDQSVGLTPIGAPVPRWVSRTSAPVGSYPFATPMAVGSKLTDSVRAVIRVTTASDLPAGPASRPVPDPEITAVPDVAESVVTNGPTTRSTSTTRLTKRNKNRSSQLPTVLTTTARSPKQVTGSGQIRSDWSPINLANNDVGASTGGRIYLASLVEPIAIRQLVVTLKSPEVPHLDYPLLTPEKGSAVTSVKATRRAWHLTMPHLSVKNASYRVGVSLAGGPDQLAGGLLGELQISPRWSVQGGIQLNTIDGFHYRDEAEFSRHRNKDFRQTYGVQEMVSTDIEDVRLTSTLVQLPIQVAYHYPLGRQWGLRLGLGTEVDLAVHSELGYDYQENNRSTERRQSVAKQTIPVFNNATLSLALERSWKKWQLRAGPFISPQLRPVSYKPEDLPWGGNVQAFYRLGK